MDMIRLAVLLAAVLVCVGPRALAEPGTDAPRLLEHAVEVDAPIDQVWHAWTTNSGVRTFFAPDADIELRPGGNYQIHFFPEAPEGQRGADTSRVVSFYPGRELTFEWGAPPSFPELRATNENRLTTVTITLTPVTSERTRVHLAQRGWQQGDDWDGMFDYFNAAWPSVLESLRQRFISGPRDFGERAAATPRPDAPVDPKYLTPRESTTTTVLPIPVQVAWDLWTTKPGLESWLVPRAEVDLRVGGWLRTSYNPNQPIPGPDTIHMPILALEPLRVLALKTTGPEVWPEVRRADDTTMLLRFEPVSPHATRVTASVTGYRFGGQWDTAFDYFEKTNPIVWRQLQQRAEALRTTPPAAEAFAALRALAGTWTADQHLPSGQHLRGRTVWATVMNETALIADGYLGIDADPHHHGHLSATIDHATDTVQIFHLGEGGALSRGAAWLEGDAILIDWPTTAPGGATTPFRVRITPADDHYTFAAWIPGRGDDPLVEITYRRAEPGPAP